MCNIPKNPQRKPKPRAADDSGWNTSEASFSCSFSIDFLNSSYSSVSTGYKPANTIGFTSSNPLIASLHGFSTSVSVSPTLISLATLIPEMIYPTSPVLTISRGSLRSFRMPTSSAL